MRHSLKFTAAFLFSILVRLIPFRPANVEPLMGTLMPFGSKFNVFSNVALTMGSMLIYDKLTAFGSWSWETAITYGIVAAAASLYFKRFTPSRTHYAGFAVVATLFYDFVTGPLLPSLLHNGNFTTLAVAQIPFTISHLCGNVIVAVVLSPIIQKYIVENPNWEFSFNPVKDTKKSAA